jgi:hypothetical protein
MGIGFSYLNIVSLDWNTGKQPSAALRQRKAGDLNMVCGVQIARMTTP